MSAEGLPASKGNDASAVTISAMSLPFTVMAAQPKARNFSSSDVHPMSSSVRPTACTLL
jgi:hypothetical protein